MNYRNTRCYLNCEKHIYDGIGEYEFPYIHPQDIDVDGVPLLAFQFAKTEKEPENKICHFFVDDYQFERVWHSPDHYLSVLQRFKAVLSPDFSMYTDFPRAISIFNHYRTQWCGAYWQDHGINVIPTIGWVGRGDDSFVWDGIPRNALVCISTVGSFSKKEYRDLWLDGYHRALDVLQPKKVLFYGKLYPEIDIPEGVEYTVAVNQNMQRLSEIRDNRRKKAREEKERAKMRTLQAE